MLRLWHPQETTKHTKEFPTLYLTCRNLNTQFLAEGCFLIYFKFTTHYVIANSNPIISSLSCTLNSQYAKNDINSLETHSVLYHSISHHCLYLISGKNKRIKNQSCICYGKSEEKFKSRKILSNYFSEIIQNLVVKYLKYSCKCSLA